MASILLIVDSLTALKGGFARECKQIVVISDNFANFIDIPVKVVSSISEIVKILPTIQADFIAYLPCGIDSITLPDTTLVQNYLAPLLLEVTLPQETAKEMSMASGWIASTEIAKFALPQLKSWTLLEIAQVLENAGVAFLWGGVATHNITQGEVDKKNNLQVLAIVTHYRCEAWLKRCLASLVNQTRAPDRIVVVDDRSENPPISIVEQFPQITLLASSDNVGTYRLIQQVITDTNYDAYLFQDADDWSSCDRLEKLLQALTLTGAELVGTQELRVYDDKITPVCYPLDVNAALKEKPGHPLIHGSSLVTRDLVMRLGGFATGLRFGGDTEFLLRAYLAAKVVNIPYYCYYHRQRLGSLTTAVDTGLNSPARNKLIKVLKARALANYAALQSNHKPCLTPLITASSIKLKYIAGFPLVDIKLEVIAIVKDRVEIEQCIESLLKIKYIDRITICDGGSIDTQCIAGLQKLACKCDRISILNFPTTGFNKSKLLNYAIANSTSDLLLISDADIIWNQDAVDKLVSKAAANTICYVQDVEESQTQSVAVKRDRYTYNIHVDNNTASIEIVPWSEHSGDMRPGCGLICTRKSTLINLGGYKELFTGWGWEDQDLLIRAKLLGIKIATDGKVIHLSHDDTKRNQYCNNFQPSQTRNRNIITCLTSLAQGVLLGDLRVENHRQPKPYNVSFQLPDSLTKDLA